MVGAIRLSKHTDASTSPEVQEEMIVKTGERVGGTFVGWAKDTDVSALKTTPWEREELGVWLNDPGSWDVMIWQRMDRAVRSMADMADLGRYAKQRKKRLIFASGPGGDMLELDFASPMSELIMLILAFAAQLEGQTIMERNQELRHTFNPSAGGQAELSRTGSCSYERCSLTETKDGGLRSTRRRRVFGVPRLHALLRNGPMRRCSGG